MAGGQCPDPGYPGSGYLIGESFEEGAVITFGCSDTGFEPLNADGTEFTGLVCNRSETTGELSWVGDVPTCEGNYALATGDYCIISLQHNPDF